MWEEELDPAGDCAELISGGRQRRLWCLTWNGGFDDQLGQCCAYVSRACRIICSSRVENMSEIILWCVSGSRFSDKLQI
jgi:hypothetical protein